MTIWLNDGLVDHAAIDPADRGFTLGDGLFETIRVQGGQLCHAMRHWQRLRAGAALLSMPLVADAALSAACGSVLHANELTEGSLRVTLTRGVAPRGVLPPANARPTLLITAAPKAETRAAAKLIIARGTRRNEHSPLARVKSLNYLDSILARQEAELRGADDAVMLNCQGRVAEGTASNLFLLIDGVLRTPPVAEGALPGIARGVVLGGVAVTETLVTETELLRAEAIILTNALMVRPAHSLEGRPLAKAAALVACMRSLLLSAG